MFPEQRQAKDILKKARLWVFTIYRLSLNEILKDILQEERKLDHMEGLKWKVGLWVKNLANMWYAQTYINVQDSQPCEGLSKHT